MPWESASKNPLYGKAAWRRARLACLQSAKWRCQIRGPDCTGTAVTADHVHGIDADPEHRHLQAACQPCHDAKTRAEAARGRKRAAPADPPCRPRTQW